MGLFKKIKGNKSQDSKSNDSKLLTHAKDPAEFDKDKLNKDLEKLEAWDKKIKSIESPEISKSRKYSQQVEEALRIDNPFTGK